MLSEDQLGILAFLPTRPTPQNKTRLTPQNKSEKKNKFPAVTDCMAPGLNIKFAIVAEAVPLKHLSKKKKSTAVDSTGH